MCLRGTGFGWQEPVEEELGKLKAKLEEMTRRAITVCLSHGQREIDFQKMQSALFYHRGEEAECIQKIRALWDDHTSQADTTCLSIGEHFAVILNRNTPKGKVYLIPDELLSQMPEDVATWIKEHPNMCGVVENIGPATE